MCDGCLSGAVAVKVYGFPDGSCEGHAIYCPPQGGGPLLASRAVPVVGRELASGGAAGEQYREDNRKRSARRSRKTLIRHVRARGMDCLGTLTFGGERLPDVYEALNLAVEWFRRHGRAILGDVSVVFVPEHGERGGRIHVHFGYQRGGGFVDYRALVRSWSAFLDERGYRSPCGTHRAHLSRSLPARRLSLYLAKYLGKALDDMEVPMGAHRFRTLRCEAVEPVWVTVLPSVEALRGALGLSARELFKYERKRPDGVRVVVGYGFEGG